MHAFLQHLDLHCMVISDSAIGIMDGAFFVPKGELIEWVNNLLDLSITRVEQCASGAVYCQIIDALFPGKVAMKRVNWSAKLDYEFLPNYKILQRAFDDCNISKHIEVDRLVRAKFQDNLEFLQWLKSFYESNTHGGSYDAKSRREVKKKPAFKSPEKPSISARERDFYFEKLRAIEILLDKKTDSSPEVAGLIAEVQSILFAEDTNSR